MSIENKFFPIKTLTSCRWKWSQSSIYLPTGQTASCHRASHSNLNENNFENFHNTPEKLRDRTAMLNGQWPGHGCEYCKDIENAGGVSDRQFQNTIPNIYPKELDIDNTLVKVNPAVLEIFFNNTCNFSCVYCKSHHSSKIEQEDKKFKSDLYTLATGNENTYSRENKFSKKFTPLMFKYLEKNLSKLQRIHILGGEPFLQKEFQDIIKLISNNPNKNLELNVVSNINIPKKQFVYFVNLINKLIEKKYIKRFDLLASVESLDKTQEYTRYGFSTELFIKNFEYLLQKTKFRLGLLSTINVLNLKSLPSLIDKINQWRETRTIYWYPHLVLPTEESVLSPIHYDYSLFKNDIEYVEKNYNLKNLDDKKSLDVFKGLCLTIKNKSNNNKKAKKLLEFMAEVDNRRNLNSKEIFPWLYEYVNKLND